MFNGIIFFTALKMKVEEKLVSIIGLGYVGLPLAIEFGKDILQLVTILLN